MEISLNLLYHKNVVDITKFKNFLLDLFFPKFCLSCQREGTFLCQDCQATLEISGFHQRSQKGEISDLYFALEYKRSLIKKLIQKFKYQPFVRELSQNLSSLIINHFLLMDSPPPFFGGRSDFILIPVPLEKRRLKWRGFNQAEEIAKELAKFFKIPICNDVLIKIKSTLPQVELSEEERKENIKKSFLVKNKELIQDKKILLVDDVYTTGATMEECARILKEAGVKEIIGIVIARAKPGDDTHPPPS